MDERKKYAEYIYSRCYLTTKGKVDSHIDAKDIAKECALIICDCLIRNMPDCEFYNDDVEFIKKEIKKK